MYICIQISVSMASAVCVCLCVLIITCVFYSDSCSVIDSVLGIVDCCVVPNKIKITLKIIQILIVVRLHSLSHSSKIHGLSYDIQIIRNLCEWVRERERELVSVCRWCPCTRTSSVLTTTAKMSAGSFLESLSNTLFMTVFNGHICNSLVCCNIRNYNTKHDQMMQWFLQATVVYI